MSERPQRPAEEWPIPPVVNLWLHQLALMVTLDQHLQQAPKDITDLSFAPRREERIMFELKNAQQGIRRGIVARFEDLEAEGYGHHARQVIWARLGKAD